MALSRRHLAILIATSALAVGIAGSAAAGEPRLALQGHDPVAYFTMGRPTKGTDNWSYVYDETRYLFANAKHREMFIADPDKYAPMYNGYCARGMVKGRKFEPNPENWAIVEGRLFVASGSSGAGPLVMEKGQIVQGKAQWEIVRKGEK